MDKTIILGVVLTALILILIFKTCDYLEKREKRLEERRKKALYRGTGGDQ